MKIWYRTETSAQKVEIHSVQASLCAQSLGAGKRPTCACAFSWVIKAAKEQRGNTSQILVMQCAAPASQPGIGDQRPSGDDEIAVTFFFGETAAQLQLTQGEVRALSAKAMAEIWKVQNSSQMPCHAKDIT